jgi:mono/diheme cytochrome c family protein
MRTNSLLDRLRFLAVASCAAAALTAAACGGSSSPSGPSTTPPPATGGGSTTATLSTLSSQIFGARCTGCHGGSAPAASMNLEANNVFENLVNRASTEKPGAVRVVPGDPNGSYLVQKLRGDVGITGVRMPRGGPYLTDDQINLVIQWIQDGAKNN